MIEFICTRVTLDLSTVHFEQRENIELFNFQNPQFLKRDILSDRKYKTLMSQL